ncbi:MAG: [CysO sulfur-carrier protein]-S-L-cysteine hydrolase [Acidimicrobiaceae bacterium]
MLRLSETTYLQMIGHALDGYPLEACGLIGGTPRLDSARVDVFYPTENEAASAKLYTIPGKAFVRSMRDADERGLELVGVMHSHTHTDAYPSPTDVQQAPEPDWHYVIVSLRQEVPVLRSYRIVDGTIAEESVVVERR